MLWEGNLIKAHLVRHEKDKTPLHEGMIEEVLLLGEQIITAGQDGYIRFWDFNEIDNVDPDEAPEVAISPLREVQLVSKEGIPAHILQLIKQDTDTWLVSDARGKIWSWNLETNESKEILHFHSGALSDLAVSPNRNAAVTLGYDGSMRLWDYLNDAEVYTKRFEGHGMCSDWLPFTEVNQGRVIACGFDTGIVRIIWLGNQNF